MMVTRVGGAPPRRDKRFVVCDMRLGQSDQATAGSFSNPFWTGGSGEKVKSEEMMMYTCRERENQRLEYQKLKTNLTNLRNEGKKDKKIMFF